MKEKNSGLNLLAIISVVLISLYCFVNNTYGLFNEMDINTTYHMFSKYIAYIGIDVFILISFYYMNETEIKVAPLLKKEFILLFYSLIGVLFFTGLLKQEPIMDTIYNICPLITSKYWFITDYLIICALSPFINNYMASVTADINKYLIYTNTILWSLIPTIAAIFINSELNIISYTRILWFLTLYFIAVHFRNHLDSINSKIFNGKQGAIISFVLLMLSAVAFTYLGEHYTFFENKEFAFCVENNILIVICAINLFVEFQKIKVTSLPKKEINMIFDCLFGIFICFNNEYLMNSIRINIFGGKFYADSESFFNFVCLNYIPFSIVVFVFVIVFCFLMEYARLFLVEMPLFEYIGNLHMKYKQNKEKRREARQAMLSYDEDLNPIIANEKIARKRLGLSGVATHKSQVSQQVTQDEADKSKRKEINIDISKIKARLPIIKITKSVSSESQNENAVVKANCESKKKKVRTSRSENKKSVAGERNVAPVTKEPEKQVSKEKDMTPSVQKQSSHQEELSTIDILIQNNPDINRPVEDNLTVDTDTILQFLYSDSHQERHLAQNNQYHYPEFVDDFYGELFDSQDAFSEYFDIGQSVSLENESERPMLSVDELLIDELNHHKSSVEKMDVQSTLGKVVDADLMEAAVSNPYPVYTGDLDGYMDAFGE